MSTAPLLRVRGLTVSYANSPGEAPAVRGVDLDVARGEVVAVVGSSGSGKSTTAHAVIGLLPGRGRILQGSIELAGRELTGLSDKAYRSVRGREVGLVPQDPAVSLNPVRRVGEQVAEALTVHGLATRRAAALDAVELLARTGLPDPGVRARQYPHQLSGGMRQRVLIAIALAARPALVIADEPTSALDVTVQAQILDQLDLLRRENDTAVLLITHDLALAGDRADRVVVMSEGEVVESGSARDVLQLPTSAVTRELVAHAPSLARTTPRRPPSPVPGPPLLQLDAVSKRFPLPRASASRELTAVDGVSLEIARGETFALVGESGSGKSTTARLAMRLEPVSEGRVLVDGADVTHVRGAQWRALRRRMQLVYQDPFASLDPRLKVQDIVTEPLAVFGIGNRVERSAQAAQLLDKVGLASRFATRRPRELSGGQRQRVAIARALALSPELVVCDEPVSALDVSVQAQVLELLQQLQDDLGLTYLFISHDLAVVRQIAHRVGVMQAGRLIEVAPTAQLFDTPQHDYTRALLDAIPGRAALSAKESL